MVRLLAVLVCTLLAGRLAAEDSVSATGLELANPADIVLTVHAGAHAMKHGITPQLLRGRIEPKLAEAGIRYTNFAAVARLEVQADADSTGSFFSLTVNFHRPVSFEAGQRKFQQKAITWNRSMQGSFNQQTNVVVALAEMLAQDFIDDHKKANPASTLRGKVSAADPKFQFVILNIGADAGVKAEQEFAVERKGETVAFVRVKTVHSGHSIGNILQTPPPQEVLEGDEVVPRR